MVQEVDVRVFRKRKKKPVVNILESQTMHEEKKTSHSVIYKSQIQHVSVEKEVTERKKKGKLQVHHSFQKDNTARERVCKAFSEKTLDIQNVLKGRDSSGAFVGTRQKGTSQSRGQTDENVAYCRK